MGLPGPDESRHPGLAVSGAGDRWGLWGLEVDGPGGPHGSDGVQVDRAHGAGPAQRGQADISGTGVHARVWGGLGAGRGDAQPPAGGGLPGGGGASVDGSGSDRYCQLAVPGEGGPGPGQGNPGYLLERLAAGRRRSERPIAHGAGLEQRGEAPFQGAGAHGGGRDGGDLAGGRCCGGDAAGEPAGASERGPGQAVGADRGVDGRGAHGHGGGLHVDGPGGHGDPMVADRRRLRQYGDQRRGPADLPESTGLRDPRRSGQGPGLPGERGGFRHGLVIAAVAGGGDGDQRGRAGDGELVAAGPAGDAAGRSCAGGATPAGDTERPGPGGDGRWVAVAAAAVRRRVRRRSGLDVGDVSGDGRRRVPAAAGEGGVPGRPRQRQDGGGPRGDGAGDRQTGGAGESVADAGGPDGDVALGRGAGPLLVDHALREPVLPGGPGGDEQAVVAVDGGAGRRGPDPAGDPGRGPDEDVDGVGERHRVHLRGAGGERGRRRRGGLGAGDAPAVRDVGGGAGQCACAGAGSGGQCDRRLHGQRLPRRGG